MPLHGKIVVIKRTGGDGTEFPLTASCLFGRKPDCDIRIQLPQVSKEHCRIDLNENKEVILTNLSSVNPTRVNGEPLQQFERLKHGDVITIIDRSFRFEYPPAPTPKKRSSLGAKTETLKVLQDLQVGDTVSAETGENKISEVSKDPHLKDGANNDNIQRSLEKPVEVESKEDGSLLQSKTTSPFNDLYQMIKKSLDVKTPRKSSASLLQTPASRFCTPKPGSVRESVRKSALSTEDKSTPKKVEVSVGDNDSGVSLVTFIDSPLKSGKKQRKSFQSPSTEEVRPEVKEAENAAKSEATSPQRRIRAAPQRFTVGEVIEQVSAETPKSPSRRRSKDATPAKAAVNMEQEEQAAASPKTERRASPRNSPKDGKVKERSQKRKSRELGLDFPAPQKKKKRVSFGGFLCPELFDKRLPPDSPLRKGATPRRSLSLSKPKQSLLRRASVIGLQQEFEQEHPGSPKVQNQAKKRTPSPKKSSSAEKSPKSQAPGKKSPKSRSPSPKAATPGKKSPKSKSPSPKAATPGKKSPKSRSPSPKAATPGKKSPKSRSPSPKAATPGKKSPKSKSPSPKVATPGKKSPKSKSPSPKAATPGKKSPKSKSPSPKAATPGKESPKTKSASPARGRSPSRNKVETPKSVTPGVKTPTVQGRFSVSRISTPSPVAEDAIADQLPLVTVTPKIPLRRKSMKSTSRKTPHVMKSAVKVMLRRSGISRASMKGSSSWADIVKFGQTKSQVAAPAQTKVTKKTMKKAVSKPQTPARKLMGHFSTGHADSPVTIVVGRAHKQKVVHPTGAAPRLVTNIALLKKNMKMDEDLTGVSEIFKTPVNEKKRSVIGVNSAMKTPVGGLGTSTVESSVLNTPEEPGEMMVSPLGISTVKDERYNSEAVQRLLNGDQESNFISDFATVDTHPDEPSEQQCTDLKMTSVTTPKQKPELPECLTGVKRTMKTPRQKAEPVEDLRGKLLKTPKQKPEQQECLTGLKRIMKTPKQKTEPIEDIRGRLLTTPIQKPDQQECLTGVKRIFNTPQQEAEPLKEEVHGKPVETPKALDAGDVSLEGTAEPVETQAHMQESEDLSEITDMKTPDVKSFPVVCLTGIKRIMKTPKERSASVEDMVGLKRLIKTPREKSEPVEENFGIKRLMKSPKLRGNAPVEDFEGLQELMEEPLTDLTGQLETNEVEDRPCPDHGEDVAKELDFAHEEPLDNMPSDVIDNVPQADMEKEADANEVVVTDHLVDVPSGHDNESSDAVETISEAAVDENVSEEQPKEETSTSKASEMDAIVTDSVHEKKSVRGRRAKTVESKPAEDKQEAAENSEEPVIPAPVRGRRGKKTEAIAPPAVRQATRSRNVKTTDSSEPAIETSTSLPTKVALKPKRERNAKKASNDQVEVVQEVATETEVVPEPESESPPVDVSHEANQEKAVLKPKRGRKTKQPEQSVSYTHSDDAPHADMEKADANKVCSDQLGLVPNGSDENKPSDTMETVPQVPATECLSEVKTATSKVTEMDAAVIQKKPVRGRRAKAVESEPAEDERQVTVDENVSKEQPTEETSTGKASEMDTTATDSDHEKKSVRGRRAKTAGSKPAEDKQEAAENSEEPVLPAPVRGRRGKKTEAIAPPAVRQATRSRSSKTQETSDEPEMVPEKAVETPVTEAVSNQTSLVNTNKEENDSAPPAEESVVKPIRGRKSKQMPVAPPQPVRAKRGRNAKQEEEKLENGETTKTQEPVKKTRRTRKVDQDPVEPREEVQAVEVVIPEETEAPLVAESVKMNEQAAVAAKPRRGRKAKQDTETETPVNSTEVQDVPVISSTDKPKRGRRGTRVAEEVEVTAVVPEEKPDDEPEAEEKNNAEPEAPVIKRSRARGVKDEVSQTIPVKRARRGAAVSLEETNAESSALVSESAPTTVEPAKRGRRAAAAKPTTDDATVTSDQANTTKDLSTAVAEEAKVSKRAVKWKSDVEVFDIPKVTPAKAGRGRKSKLGEENVSKDANKAEEKDLSEEVAKAQPIKRARRGAKVADEAESTGKEKSTEAETQLKTRRGRPAKK
ncbi:proliferation marker protein Ki-67 isoform X2 [Pempheris klunzingeri]|uniref:proliferation marker protein Ki-67 isoform X2 n=1 Tax=Pempheris klunzingeri TaxID=3127111 RepID=UPI00397FFF6A